MAAGVKVLKVLKLEQGHVGVSVFVCGEVTVGQLRAFALLSQELGRSDQPTLLLSDRAQSHDPQASDICVVFWTSIHCY